MIIPEAVTFADATNICESISGEVGLNEYLGKSEIYPWTKTDELELTHTFVLSALFSG